jgi:hypothetical protein
MRWCQSASKEPAFSPRRLPCRGRRLGNLGTGRARVAALRNAGGLTGAATQIVKLGAADGAAADHIDAVDVRAVQREDALDALAEADLADGEAAAHATVRAGDADTFEILDAGAVAFDHLHADAQRVARAEFRHRLGGGIALDLLGFERLDQVHVSSFPSRRCAPEGDGLRAPPWRSIRSGRLSRVSASALCLRQAAIFA